MCVVAYRYTSASDIQLRKYGSHQGRQRHAAVQGRLGLPGQQALQTGDDTAVERVEPGRGQQPGGEHRPGAVD
jgi:hypothetical protein